MSNDIYIIDMVCTEIFVAILLNLTHKLFAIPYDLI